MDAETIVAAGFAVLDDVGYERLSMRHVAQHLEVRVGGLYYHVADKRALLRAMADRMCCEVLESMHRSGDWYADAHAFAVALRTRLHATRDGARLMSESPLMGSIPAFALMDALVDILEDGVPDGRSRIAADALMSYVTGFVVQEQVGGQWPPDWTPAMLSQLWMRFPRLFGTDQVDDDLTFGASVEAILRGFAGEHAAGGRDRLLRSE